MNADLRLRPVLELIDAEQRVAKNLDRLFRVLALADADLGLDDPVLARIDDHPADDLLVGNGDLLSVLADQDGVGEGNIFDHAGRVLVDGDGVADRERPRQDDRQPGAVVRKRPLNGDGGAERRCAGERDQRRYGNAEVAERYNHQEDDCDDLDDVADEPAQGRIDVLGIENLGDLSSGPARRLEADEQEEKSAQDLEAVGDGELDEGIQPPGYGLDLLDDGVFDLLIHRFLPGEFRC